MSDLVRAVSLHRAGDIAAAEILYRRILEGDPGDVDALHLLGVAALQRGDAGEAEALIGRATALVPDRGEFQRNLGLARLAQDRLAEAAASLERAAALDPRDAAALINLGAARLKQRNLDGAIAVLQRALVLAPDSLAALSNLAPALRDRGRLDEAELCFRRALELAPGSVPLEFGLSSLLRRLGRLEEAIAALWRALKSAPKDGEIAATLQHDLLRLADWEGAAELAPIIDRASERALAAAEAAPESAFLNLLRSEDPARNLLIARTRARQISRNVEWARRHLDRSPKPSADGRIRIGYLTADIHDHPTAHLAAGLFAAHDRRRFDVHLYSHGPDDGSSYRRKIAAEVEHFIDIRGLDTLSAARRIARDGIDIMVDLKGHTMDAWLEIAALRPAPLQLHWLGFPGSIGGDFLDYLIADPTVLPADQFTHYSEKILRLPHCYQIDDDAQEIAPAPSRAEAGLPPHGFVFCCFNHFHKMEARMFDLWMGLLRETPDAVLWLLQGPVPAEANLRGAAAARGVAPERLIFAPPLPKPRHLARLALSDLALDTRIYNGHTTSSDALWAGVPLVALLGRHFASRVSASLLRALNLDELVVESFADYGRLAIELAHDRARLGSLRAKLAEAKKTAPLFDTKRFVRDLERGYEVIWSRHQAGLPPDHLDIAAAPSPEQTQQALAAFACGNEARVLKDNASAEKFFRQALALDPHLANAAYNLGNLLRETGRSTQAIAAYRQAIAAQPGQAAAAFNLGLALVELGEIEEAAASYRHAIRQMPAMLPAHVNLTLALRDLGRLDEAWNACRAALALDPASALALMNEALLLSDEGRLDESRERLERILAREPDQADALLLLAGQLPREEIERAIALLEKAAALRPEDSAIPATLLNLQQNVCAWAKAAALAPAVDRQTDEAIRLGRRSAETPFAAIARSEDPARHLAISRTWAGHYKRQAARLAPRWPSWVPSDDGRIRIAYLGNNFHDSPIAQLILGLFRRHDRGLFRVFVYSYGPDDGSIYRRRIASDAEGFVDIAGVSDAEAAARIRADGADILVDLDGYIKGARLAIAALRPAPVQAAYFGYPGTTGAAFFDYVIADRIVAPLEQARHFSEAICRLPHCYLPMDDEQPIAAEPIARADCGLPAEGFVFCSFNQAYKIDAETFAAWMRLLDRVKGSVLWLLRANRAAERNLRQAAASAGVDPSRLVFAPRLPKDRHLKRMALADLALDTRIYNGHVSSVDALWAGVPLLAMRGRHFAARVAASLLAALDLPELIALDLAAYESLALRLASDPVLLAGLREKLAQQRHASPVFDTARITRDLERAFAEMWRRHLAGEHPSALDL